MVIVVAALLLVLIIPNGSNAQSVVLTTSACTPLGGTWTVQADITYTIGQTITQVDFVNSNGFTLRADTVYGSRSAFNIQSGSAATGRWVAVFTLSNVAATDNVGTVMVRITTTPGSTFRINTPTISGPTIAPPTEVYTVGFNTMEVNNGSTQLRCSVSCNTGSSSFTWYRNSVAVGTTSGSTSGLNTPFDAVDSGLYTCEPTGSSAKAPALWVGTPVYQCPFDRFAWCPSGAITRFMDRVPRPIIPTTMTAFGIVLVCGDVTSTASKAVSTRGSCPALTVCSDDIGIGPYTCSNNSPILYGTCNEKFSYYCPSMYVFSASTITGGGPQLVTGETRRIMVYDTSYTTAFKLWCGTEYSIIAPCHPDIGGSYTPHPTSFDIVRVGPNWTTGGITNAETISVAVGDYFRIDCPASDHLWRFTQIHRQVDRTKRLHRKLGVRLVRQHAGIDGDEIQVGHTAPTHYHGAANHHHHNNHYASDNHYNDDDNPSHHYNDDDNPSHHYNNNHHNDYSSHYYHHYYCKHHQPVYSHCH
ncbi:hypothetical protein [Crucian carp herpesvirus]|nr:hypothetical protein [Crucian carp herpesvirus]